MGRLLRRRWVILHAATAPYGIAAAIAVMMALLGNRRWRGLETLVIADDLVALATLAHSIVFVTIEAGAAAMFWALDNRRERRARIKAEGREEGRAEGFIEGRDQAREALRAWLERRDTARMQGINFNEPMP